MHDLKRSLTVNQVANMPIKKLKRLYGIKRAVMMSRENLVKRIIERGYKPYAHIAYRKKLEKQQFNTILKASGLSGRKGLTKVALIDLMVERKTGYKGEK